MLVPIGYDVDAETLKLLQQAVREGAASASWLMLAAALLGAGLGAFFGPYLKRKGEDRALKENFDESLKRLEAQTTATAAIQHSFEIQLKRMESLQAQAAFLRELYSSGLREYSTSQAHGLRQAYLYLFEPISSNPISDGQPWEVRLEMAVQAVMKPMRDSIGLLDEETIQRIQGVQNELLALRGKPPEEVRREKNDVFKATDVARQFVKAHKIAYRLGLTDDPLEERKGKPMSKMRVVVRKVPESNLALGRRTLKVEIGQEIDVLDDEVKDAEEAIKNGYLEKMSETSG